MISPALDCLAIRNIIESDEYIKSLGFTQEKIYNTNTTDDLIEKDSFQIFIYPTQSRPNYSNIKTLTQVMQIDISVPVEQPSCAYNCATQIIALLQDRSIDNGSTLDLVAPSPCSLASVFGTYCLGIRFAYTVTKYNEIKKIGN